ncbi:hypothetical protein GcC1_048013 [Golovinomyces cichoracearum]|uniref:Srp40 C-terminal domain-containing protein n=1 Tax=Golovinomyces cichoracearum TaxID=62708 RepID=A0A420IXI5_9PEZI|nr:hypothetical protein GcC1_048013 [Golovinomyces cichoracearum]
MSFNPNQIKLGKKKTTSKKTPEWLFPDKIDSQSKSSQEAKEMSKKKLAKQVADNLLKRRAAGETSKTKPCSRLLDAVDAFLIEIGYSNSSKAFKAERKSHGENGINIKNTLSLIDIFNEWQKIHTSKEHQDTEIKVAVDRERDVKSKKAGNNHAQASGRNACSNTSSPKKCQGSDVHMADATEDGSSSSSSSDSSSSSSTSSDSDADDEKDVVPIKTPDPSKPRDNGKKRKASFSNDSDSSSNQSKSKSKKMKIGAKISDSPAKSSSNSSSSNASSDSSSSNDSSSSDSDSTSDENPTTAKAGKNDSSSSDSSSSDSESTSDENPTTAKAGKNDSSSSNSSSSDSNSSSSDGDSSSSDSDSSSSDSDSSSSDSDSSSSDGDSETSTQSSNKSSTHQISKSDSKSSGTSKSKIDDKEMTAIATSKNPSNTAKTGNAPESSTKFLLPATAGGKSTKTLNSKRSIDDPASFGKKPNEPFSRIPKDIKINEKLASNAYVPYDYAQKAHEDLIVTKGKNFTKEKNKKKRGSYRGGHIDVEDKKGIKFED